MSTTVIIIIVALIAVVALVALQGRGGPRVTHIETRRDVEEKDDRDA